MQLDTAKHNVMVELPDGLRLFSNVLCATHTALDFFKRYHAAPDARVAVICGGRTYRGRMEIRALEADARQARAVIQ